MIDLASDPVAELCQQWRPLVSWCVRHQLRPSPLPGTELDEEAHAVGLLALARAARAFDPSRGVKFKTWAARCISNELWQWLRRERSHGVKFLPQGHWLPMVSLSAPVPSALGDGDGDADLAAFVADSRDTPDPFAGEGIQFETLVERLECPRLRAIVRAVYRDGLTDGQVGRRLGVSKQWVRTLRERALEQLRQTVPELEDVA